MKTKLLIIVALFGLAASALADPTTNTPSVLLAWDKSPETSVAGYRVYYGVGTRNYTNNVTVNGIDTLTCTVTNLARGLRYYFAATAWTAGGLESAYSAEVTYDTLPLPPSPANVTINVIKP